jgi:hypothetical protein
MPNMAMEVWGENPTLLLTLHLGVSPTDAEWQAYLDVIGAAEARTDGFSSFRALAITDGGAPGTLQRARLNRLIKGRSVPAAVVSEARLVRGVVNTLNFFNPGIRAFAPTSFTDAVVHLGMPATASDEVLRQFNLLQEKLPPVKALQSINKSRAG